MTGVEDWLIEATLDEAGRAWKRREPGWVVPAGVGCPAEVVVVPESGGLRVEAALASWDGLGADEREALGRFLARAGRSLGAARCEVEDKRALVWAHLDAPRVEAELAGALASVSSAAARLAREAAALATPEVARGYLRFFAAAEMAAAVVRM